MINITDAARDKLKEFMKEEEGKNLRINVVGGGCSGLSYKFIFTNHIDLGGGDNVKEINGISVVINVKSLMYIMDSTLDYTDGLNGKGLEIINPNATRTCACGESFSV